MICSNCKMRWADFPEKDFIIDDKGIHAKSNETTERRSKVFESDDIKYCGCIERDQSGLD